MDKSGSDRYFSLWQVGISSVLVVVILIGVFVSPLFLAGETTENETLNEFETVPLLTEDGSGFVFEEDTVINVQGSLQENNYASETRYDVESESAIIRLNHLDMLDVNSTDNENKSYMVLTAYFRYNESSESVEGYSLWKVYNVSEGSFVNSSELNYDGVCRVNSTAVVKYTKSSEDEVRALSSSGRYVLHSYSRFLGYSVMESGNNQIIRLENGWYSPESSLSYTRDGLVHVTDSSGRVVAEDVNSSASLRAGSDYAGDNDKKYVVRDANFSATITLYDRYERVPVIKWWDSETAEIRHTVDEEKTDVSVTRPEYVDAYNSSCT